MACKGICVSKYGGVPISGGGWSTRKHCKKCKMCYVYINYDGNRCLCCKNLLSRRIGKQHLSKVRI